MVGENVSVTYGPPGCGKTTWVVQRAAELIGEHGPTSVVIASLTKVAAQEVRSRRLPVPERQVGTLHSLAYRALGIREKDVASPEEWPWVGRGVQEKYSLLRSSLVPREKWPRKVRKFAEEWESWKGLKGVIDFDDMLELAVKETEHAPGDPRFLFLDEAQDHSAADMRLALHWARSCEAPWKRR